MYEGRLQCYYQKSSCEDCSASSPWLGLLLWQRSSFGWPGVFASTSAPIVPRWRSSGTKTGQSSWWSVNLTSSKLLTYCWSNSSITCFNIVSRFWRFVNSVLPQGAGVCLGSSRLRRWSWGTLGTARCWRLPQGEWHTSECPSVHSRRLKSKS